MCYSEAVAGAPNTQASRSSPTPSLASFDLNRAGIYNPAYTRLIARPPPCVWVYRGGSANANANGEGGAPVTAAAGNGNSADHALLDSDMSPFYQLKMVSE